MAELAKLMGKSEPEKVVVVYVGATLAKITRQGPCADLWPRHAAVNELATEGQNRENWNYFI